MGCSCKKKIEQAEAEAKATASSVTVEVPTVPILVRDGDHPLACEFCLEKHVAVAQVYAVESAENADRTAERLLCFAHLSCAEEHARALGRTEFADKLAEARAAFMDRGDFTPVLGAFYDLAGERSGPSVARLGAIGALARAEDLMRIAGFESKAAKVREVRREFAAVSATNGDLPAGQK